MLKDAYTNSIKKRKTLLQCARQIYGIIISFINDFQDIKSVLDASQLTEENRKKTEDYKDKIDYYKTQIGKFSLILMSDEWDEKTELINKEIILEHKNSLNNAKKNQNNIKIMETLLSLRLTALQTTVDLRKNFIDELIIEDILFIKENKNNYFINELLNIHSYQIRHSILSIISIISSTYDGVNYLLTNNFDILLKIIEIMKGTEDGQVLQRFCISILNKMSIKIETIDIYLKYGIIDWIVKLLQRSRINYINNFCIDFSSALLANILHAKITLDFLENNNSICLNLMETFLSMISEKISPTSLKHFIMCLGYLDEPRFDKRKEECRFNERIDEFFDHFSKISTNNEDEELEKHNILDLCKYIFPIHGEKKNNVYGGIEGEERNYEKIIKEYENQKGSIVFECFQDEVC